MEECLTAPSVPAMNHNFDNINSDLIVYRNMIIVDPDNKRFQITKFLGKGTFGQVFSAIDLTNNTNVAIKISKSSRTYRQQAFTEVQNHIEVCIFFLIQFPFLCLISISSSSFNIQMS